MSNDHPYTSEGNSIIKFLWNVLFVIFYPLITTFSLLFMGVLYVFSGLSKLFSRISASTEVGIEIKKPEWKPFLDAGKYKLENLYVDEIMFGPSYFKVKAYPEIAALENKLFGDFYHPFQAGFIFVQWNTTAVQDVPDFQLVYFNAETGTLKALRQLKSFSWNVAKSTDDEVVIKWFTGTEGGEIIITKEDVAD